MQVAGTVLFTGLAGELFCELNPGWILALVGAVADTAVDQVRRQGGMKEI